MRENRPHPASGSCAGSRHGCGCIADVRVSAFSPPAPIVELRACDSKSAKIARGRGRSNRPWERSHQNRIGGGAVISSGLS